jgi:hypothetical protein
MMASQEKIEMYSITVHFNLFLTVTVNHKAKVFDSGPYMNLAKNLVERVGLKKILSGGGVKYFLKILL